MSINAFKKIGNYLSRSDWSDNVIDRAIDLIGSLADRLGSFYSRLRDPSHLDMNLEVGGSAEAIGTQTASSADLRASLVETSHSRIGIGFGEFKSAAEGGATFASTDAYCDTSGADFVFTSKVTRSGENWETTTQKVIAIDVDFFEFSKPIVIQSDRSQSLNTYFDIPDGNTATVDFDVEVKSENTLADVFAEALAVENAYSGSLIDASLIIG